MPFNRKSIDLLVKGTKLTQSQIAEKLGMGQNRLSEYKNGRTVNPETKTLDKMYKLAEEYKLPIEFYSPPK